MGESVARRPHGLCELLPVGERHCTGHPGARTPGFSLPSPAPPLAHWRGRLSVASVLRLSRPSGARTGLSITENLPVIVSHLALSPGGVTCARPGDHRASWILLTGCVAGATAIGWGTTLVYSTGGGACVLL
jgi:hypothetical protein